VLAWASAASSASADAYERRAIAGVRAVAPPVVDGKLTDAVWRTAAKAETFIDQNRGTPALDQTVALIAYDDLAIYVAFECRDSLPQGIVARETVRDSKYASMEGATEDSIEVLFDFFTSYRGDDRARFSTNPLGTPSARNSGGRAGKLEWKGDWTCAAGRTEAGWSAEMRIPWAILSFPSKREPLSIGINFQRWHHRPKIRSQWSYEGPQGFSERQGVWTGVVVPRAGFRSTVSVLPYVLAGLGGSRDGVQSGLDLRYSATPELTAVATVNPDFGTIEGAVEGIQFSRSERWVAERRPFFLEGADYLSAGTEYAIGPFFYPNRIRSFDVGAKVYGKITPKDTLGLLHAVDFGRRSDTVAQVRHDISPTTSASLFVSNVAATDDNNTAVVAQESARWGKAGFHSQWAYSGGKDAGGSAQQVNLTYEDKNAFHSVQYIAVAPDFRVADGLVWFTDYRGIFLYHVWGGEWRQGPIRGFNVELNPIADWHTDGRPFRRNVSVVGAMETRSDWVVWSRLSYGTFDGDLDSVYGAGVIYGASNRFRRVGLSLNKGRQAGKPYAFLGPSGSVRVKGKLDLGYGGSIQDFGGRTQQHIVTVNYELSPTRSFGGRLVIQDSATNWYVSYRQSGGKGAEFFVMFGDPNAERFVSSLRVKVVLAL